MPAPHVELARAAVPNEMGHVVLAFAERVLAPRDLAGLRERLWQGRTYLYVTPGPRLIERALEGFPPEVRALCARCPFHRYDARGGGGFWPDGNEIWLAAGVETYEGLRQGDHANVVEYFADIPTNFRDARELPPPIAAHFAPLIDGSPFPAEFDTALADGGNDLAAFQRSLAPA